MCVSVFKCVFKCACKRKRERERNRDLVRVLLELLLLAGGLVGPPALVLEAQDAPGPGERGRESEWVGAGE